MICLDAKGVVFRTTDLAELVDMGIHPLLINGIVRPVDHIVRVAPDAAALERDVDRLLTFGAEMVEEPHLFPNDVCDVNVPIALRKHMATVRIDGGLLLVAAPASACDQLDRHLAIWGAQVPHHIALDVSNVHAAVRHWSAVGYRVGPITDDGELAQVFMGSPTGQIVELIARAGTGDATFSCAERCRPIGGRGAATRQGVDPMTIHMSRARPTDAVLNDELQANDRAFDVVGLHAPGELQAHLLTAGTAVIIIDIVRCTTTANAIVAAGAQHLYIVVKRDGDDIDDLVHHYEGIAGDGLRLIVGGEKHGKPIPGGLFENSALDVPADMSGTNALFCSTNAGRAVEAAAELAPAGSGVGVFLASMANIDLLADTVATQGFTRIVLGCGGFYGRISLEDAVCGGRSISRMLNKGHLPPTAVLDDGATPMVALAEHFDDDEALVDALHHNRIGRALVDYGRERDIAAAITGEHMPSGRWDAMTHTVSQLTWLTGAPAFTPIPNTNTEETL
jgi:phosphosulfolactate phosphohydrolase-like enzyme